MTRMRILGRDDMNDEQGALYDKIGEEGGPRAGPYWAYIRQPSLMRLCQDVGNWFRGAALSGRERQIAVLTVVRFWDAEYPWAVQVRASLAAGVARRARSMPSTNAAILVCRTRVKRWHGRLLSSS